MENNVDDLTPAEQLQWYFDEAETGCEKAKRELGRMYFRGFTHPDDVSVKIEPDADVALEYLRDAADAGDGNAALLLGEMFDGEATSGPFNEPKEAFRRYQQAVDLGCRPARFYLGTRYLLGRGVERGDRRGREILIETAYAGDTDAQAFLSEIYRKSGDEEIAAAWTVVAGLFNSDKVSEDVCGEGVPLGTPERARLIIQKVNIYSALMECDAPVLIKAADLLREEFREEIE